MAADRSIGYKHEVDLIRFASKQERLPATTKLLWTIDDAGAHFALEQQVWDSSRGIVSHFNISQQAFFGGEAWRTGTNKLTINAASRAFGYNRDFPADLFAEAATRYQAAMRYFHQYGLEVTAVAWGKR
jgi:hypothetical protein